MSYSSEVLADSPLAYWKLDNATTDASGNGKTLTALGGTDVAGYADSGRGRSFNGSSGSATSPSITYTSAVVTLEFIANFASAAVEGVLFESSSNYNNANPSPFSYPADARYIVYMDSAAGKIQANFNNVISGLSTPYGYGFDVFNFPQVSGTHHYVFVFDHNGTGADRVKLYRDGVRVTASSYTAQTSWGVGAAWGFSAQPLYIAARGAASNFTACTLDEVAVYNTALSAARALAHAAAAGLAATTSYSRTAADSWAWSESLSRSVSTGSTRTSSDSWAWTDTAPRTRRQNVTVGLGYPGGEVYPGGATYPGGIGDHWAWYETATRGAVIHGGLGRNAGDTWTWSDVNAVNTHAVKLRTSADAWGWRDAGGTPTVGAQWVRPFTAPLDIAIVTAVLDVGPVTAVLDMQGKVD